VQPEVFERDALQRVVARHSGDYIVRLTTKSNTPGGVG
jgi:hypothetical protein